MFDQNNNGDHDPFDMAMDMMVLDEFEREERQERLESALLDTGYDRDELEMMDDDVRDKIIWDAGLAPDDYAF